MKKVLVILGLLLLPTVAFAQGMSSGDMVEMLRSDLQNGKKTILTSAMGLDEAMSAKFWPVQREYEAELTKLTDVRLANLKEYADNYANLSDVKAKEITGKMFKWESSRTALKKKYFDKISKATSPMVAAKFMQMETYINTLVDAEIRASMPAVP